MIEAALKKLRWFLYDAIFLDRDGTLNPDPGYISSLDNFELYSFTIESLKLLSLISPYLFIVTNQSGISRGLIEKKELDKIHSFLLRTFENDLSQNPYGNFKEGDGISNHIEGGISLQIDVTNSGDGKSLMNAQLVRNIDSEKITPVDKIKIKDKG